MTQGSETPNWPITAVRATATVRVAVPTSEWVADREKTTERARTLAQDYLQRWVPGPWTYPIRLVSTFRSPLSPDRTMLSFFARAQVPTGPIEAGSDPVLDPYMPELPDPEGLVADIIASRGGPSTGSPLDQNTRLIEQGYILGLPIEQPGTGYISDPLLPLQSETDERLEELLSEWSTYEMLTQPHSHQGEQVEPDYSVEEIEAEIEDRKNAGTWKDNSI